jgi:DNA-binding transcriptional ArsR family regulator
MNTMTSPAAAIDLTSLMEQARQASELMKALSHETRLLILCLLSEGEKSVSELEQILEMPQATVSQQLARLRFDRLVTTRRAGRAIHYRIADQNISTIIGALHSMYCEKK